MCIRDRSERFNWNDMGSEAYEEQIRQRRVMNIIKKAQGLGLTVVPCESAGEINTVAALA